MIKDKNNDNGGNGNNGDNGGNGKKKPWKGRHYSEDSEKTRLDAYTFLIYQNMGEFGKKELRTNYGYEKCTKLEFCEKHNVSKNYFIDAFKRNKFRKGYFDFVMTMMDEKLPQADMLLLKKDPATWIKLHFHEQSAMLLANRNINTNINDEDDAEFRNTFFGIRQN